MIKLSSQDKIIVTGASSGIGKAIAHKIIDTGGTVIAVSRDAGKLKDAFAAIEHTSRVKIAPYDLSEDVDAIPAFVKTLHKNYGRISGMVHSAGQIRLLPLQVVSKKRMDNLFNLNFWAGLMLAKGIADKRIVNSKGGSFVFVSSIGSMIGTKGQTGYAASKGAVNATIRPMAMELAKLKIRVNTVSPGHISTEMTDKIENQYSREYRNELDTMYPLGPGEPEDVANLCVFLLSGCSKWITGQNIVIDGGRMLW